MGSNFRAMEQQFGLGKERGTILVQFAISKNLEIVSTCFRKRKNKKWAWVSPIGKSEE